jgi:hypothetical protein
VTDENKDGKSIILVLLIGGGVALAILLSSRTASASEQVSAPPGDDGAFYPPPPIDGYWNPEVGDAVSGATGFPVTDSKVIALATAIATAEGFYNSNPNVIPRRGHNPGDLTVAFGEATAGVLNSEGVLQFSDDNAGWSALKKQARMMLDGSSRIYSPLMTLRQVAAKYTGGDADGSWAENASRSLGITPDQTLGDFLSL